MKFCGRCGESLTRTCPQCQQLSPLDYRFCGHCGVALALEGDLMGAGFPARGANDGLDPGAPGGGSKEFLSRSAAVGLSGERRQATVLIADVKGSTHILEQLGSETWVEVMNEVLQIMGEAIYRFGGQVDQFRGDGVLAFFGARSAHEDDPERAVMAALVMQHALKLHAESLAKRHEIELLVRVGINSGEVITANIGNRAQHHEDTTMGGAVSLAARLEASAEPGTILVSQFTYRLVEARFKWNALGDLTVRGLSQPVAVYRPLSPVFEAEQQTRLQAHGLWVPLIGREGELNAIEQAVANVRDGIGGIMMMSGEAGMGKSRLMFEARQHVEREEALGQKEPVLWLQGRCRSYGQTLPDSMWVDLCHRWLGGGHWVSREETVVRLREQVQTIAADRFEEMYPFLAALLSLPLEEPYATQIKHLDAEGLRRQFFVTMRAWLEVMSRHQPLILVFTEVHWADQASLDLLKFCLPLCMQERVLFVVVFRPERTMPVWEFNHFVETEYFHRLKALALSPLTAAQTDELIARMIGANVLSEAMRAQILEKSNGNPYYLTELLHTLIDRGTLQRAETGQWRTREAEVALQLPDTLKSLLLARIDHLSSEEKRVLQIAAVIGPIFWFKILEKLVANGAKLREHLVAMQRAQLITERGVLPDLGREYAFNSSLMREAAYDNLLSAQRTDLHLAVADFLEKIVQENVLLHYHGIVAYHFRQAGDGQRELLHTLLAAQEAQRVRANTEARQAYERALALIQQAETWAQVPPARLRDEWQLEALRGLGQIQLGIGEVQEAEKHFREAIALGRAIALSPVALTHLFYWLGEVLFWQNRFEEPIHLGEEGLRLLGGKQETIETALMNQLVAIGCSQLGDHDKFIDYTLRTAGFIQRLPYSEELRPAFDHVIALYAYTLKDLPEARRWLEVLKQKAETHYDLRALGEYYEYSAVLHFQEGKVNEAIPKHRKAIEYFTQIGDTKHVSRAWKSLGVSLLQQGEIEAARECFESALENAAVFANEADLAIGYWYLGQVLLCQGQWEEALASFRIAENSVRRVPYLREEWALSGAGRVYLAQGMREAAQATFQQAVLTLPGVLFQTPYQAYEILSGLEQSLETAEAFRRFVREYQQAHPETHRAAFRQWCLVPAEVSGLHHPPLHHEVFQHPLAEGWVWHDPFGDCAYQVQKGLVIRAANERNLHHINRSAPRLLWQTPLRGDFTLQTRIDPERDDKPAMGGLLIWLSEKYWFCLEIGGRSPEDVILRGFMNNTDMVFGRGRISGKRIVLRLERRERWLSAFCSGDGKTWLYAGGCELSTIEALRVGVHAIGHINRLVYPGAYPHGTTVRFREVWLWGREAPGPDPIPSKFP
jgi:class 3 adenylate cyclase/tetratricopeptide (TPR) repeat protein/regulation of enolase protein 1 (concanavalin A-like superfamily)